MPRAKKITPAPAVVAPPATAIVQAPRGYFENEPAGFVSKTGELPVPTPGNTALYNPGLPDELYEDRALIVLAMRQDGYTAKEICAKTGLSQEAVRYAMRKARQSGRLRDVIDLIDNEAVPQAVENLMMKLRKNAETEEFGDAEVQLLKGRGVFQNFNKNPSGAGAGSTLPALQINFIQNGGGELPSIIVNSESGEVLGKPRE